MTTVATLTARQVEQALWLHFTGSSWAPISEVTITPPGARDLQYGDPRATPRRIDMLMVRSARKPERDGAIDRLAVEIKVSRADFLSDIAVPEKQAPWREFANRHAYAAPAGLIKVEELPEGSGLLEITEAAWGRAVTWVKRAPYANRPPEDRKSVV